jgi:Glycosyltransferase
MRVLQIIQRQQFRGAEIFACQLSQELISDGHHVDIVYLFGTRGQLNEKFPSLHFLPLHANEKARLWDWPALKRLAILIESVEYDVVQANAGDTLKYAALSRMLFRWKAKLMFRNANKLGDFIRNSFHKTYIRILLSECDYYISVSERCRQDLISIHPGARDKSVTITIGSADFLNSNYAGDPRDSDPVFLNVASFVKEKNHALLIDVFHAFLKKKGRGQLWLIGSGKLLEQLRQQVDRLDLRERVKFLGATSDVIGYMKQAHVLLMTSTIEGLPGVILEAFSTGLPVVSSAVGGIPELIENGKNGFLVNAFNTVDYVNCLVQLTDDSDLRGKVRESAYHTFKSRFELNVVSAEFSRIYQKIVGS